MKTPRHQSLRLSTKALQNMVTVPAREIGCSWIIYWLVVWNIFCYGIMIWNMLDIIWNVFYFSVGNDNPN
jgi:hypothetical protein